MGPLSGLKIVEVAGIGVSGQQHGLVCLDAEDRVAIYGSLDLPRSLEGLARAHELKREIDAVVAYLERHEAELPSSAQLLQPGRIDNPFC